MFCLSGHVGEWASRGRDRQVDQSLEWAPGVRGREGRFLKTSSTADSIFGVRCESIVIASCFWLQECSVNGAVQA